MGKHKDRVIPEHVADVAYTMGWDAAIAFIKELAGDSDWVRVSDIEETHRCMSSAASGSGPRSAEPWC